MAVIFLFETHPLVHLGLQRLLSRFDPVNILTLAEFNRDLTENRSELPAPEILVIGLPFNSPAEWETLIEICEKHGSARVLVLTSFAVSNWDDIPLPSSVRGMLSANSSTCAIESAVRLILAGGECFPASFRQHGTNEPRRGTKGPDSVVVPIERWMETPVVGARILNISERQYEILTFLARGYPVKSVSRLLNISVATVKTHTTALYKRLGAKNKGEAVYIALQRGAKLNWRGLPSKDSHITSPSEADPSSSNTTATKSARIPVRERT